MKSLVSLRQLLLNPYNPIPVDRMLKVQHRNSFLRAAQEPRYLKLKLVILDVTPRGGKRIIFLRSFLSSSFHSSLPFRSCCAEDYLMSKFSLTSSHFWFGVKSRRLGGEEGAIKLVTWWSALLAMSSGKWSPCTCFSPLDHGWLSVSTRFVHSAARTVSAR